MQRVRNLAKEIFPSLKPKVLHRNVRLIVTEAKTYLSVNFGHLHEILPGTIPDLAEVSGILKFTVSEDRLKKVIKDIPGITNIKQKKDKNLYQWS